jgi:precorrin-6B methylase 2
MADGQTGLKSHKTTCVGPVSALEEHRILLADETAQNLFRRAIQEVVRPGDVVVDLGTGSGIHALFACQAGAKRVHAIDADNVIELARLVARENGFEDRIRFHFGLSQSIELPERADVVITNTGFLGTLTMAPDARKRFLKRGGRLMPSRIRLTLVPVTQDRFYREQIQNWTREKFGLRFSAFRDFAAHHPFVSHFEERDQIAEPVDLDPIVIGTDVSWLNRWQMEFEIERDATWHGISGWYAFQLSPSIWMSTKPPLALSPRLWFHPFFPLEKPLKVKRGDKVRVELGLALGAAADAPLWQWTVTHEGVTTAQSSFDAVPLSRELLGKLS